MVAVVNTWDSVDAYAAWVNEQVRLKAESESTFLNALIVGKVLVERWAGKEHVTIWTGGSFDGNLKKTAAHVSNRFRAGWTTVEVADPDSLVMPAGDLPKLQQVCIEDDNGNLVRPVVGRIEQIGERVEIHFWPYDGGPTFIREFDEEELVRLI